MADAVPNAEPTGTAPATPGASPPVTPPEASAAPAPAAAAPVIPEKYEFKLPEGRVLDAGLIDAVTPLFKEFGLTQESAGKLVEAYDKYGQAFEAAQEKQFQDFMAETAKNNLAAIRKEWGPDTDANIAIAQRGIARFLSDAGKKKLEDSGLGNDPEFLKAFYQAGKMIQEDRPPVGGKPNGRKPTEEVFYGSVQ